MAFMVAHVARYGGSVNARRTRVHLFIHPRSQVQLENEGKIIRL
jgi:hypothetical protein